MILPTLCLSILAAAAPPPFTAAEMMRLRRIADPQVSPDGKSVAYQATEVDTTSWTRNTDIWVIPAAGGAPRRITDDPKSDSRPRWSPDGQRLAFVSTRDGGAQVWVVDAAGGAPRKATSLPTEAGGVLWIDDRTLLVPSDVYPECAPASGAAYDAACNRQHLEEETRPGGQARVYDGLVMRHWDHWEDRRRTHLHVVDLASGTARDVTPGTTDVPPFTVGGPDDYDVAPDGKEIAFVRKDDPVEAVSTNGELYVVAVAGGPATRISGSAGYDGEPRYSPDGRMIAFRAQMRAGYEADRWRLMVYDRGHARDPQPDRALRPPRRRHRVVARLAHALLHRRGRRARPDLRDRGRGRDGAHRGRRGELRRPARGAGRADALRDRGHPHPSRRDRSRGNGWHRPHGGHPRERRGPRAVPPPPRRERPLHRRGRQDRAGLDREAGGLRPCPPLSAARPHPRRSPGRVGRRLELPLEPAGLRLRRLRRLHAQPARLDRLGPGVHRRRQRGLGRPRLRGRHARHGLRGGAALRREGPHRGRGRVLRRIHGRLDRRPHRPLPRARLPTTASSTCASMYGATEELWFPDWEFRGPYWDEPRDVRALEPEPLRQELQDAHPGHPRRAGLPRAPRAGPRHVHRPAAARRALAPARLPRREPLGAASPPTPCAGTTRSSAGWTAGRRAGDRREGLRTTPSAGATRRSCSCATRGRACARSSPSTTPRSAPPSAARACASTRPRTTPSSTRCGWPGP